MSQFDTYTKNRPTLSAPGSANAVFLVAKTNEVGTYRMGIGQLRTAIENAGSVGGGAITSGLIDCGRPGTVYTLAVKIDLGGTS